MQKTGAILLANSTNQAIDFVNRFAPEHLSLPGTDAAELKKSCTAAGTIFVGPYAAQPLGDYASGSNHVLPTAGWARRRGGLSTADFVKCITVQQINRTGFARLADDVQLLAERRRPASPLQRHRGPPMNACKSMYGRSTAAPQLGKMSPSLRSEFSHSIEAYQ